MDHNNTKNSAVRSPISKVIVKNVWLETDTKIVAGLNWLLESS
jgi:hypothetical protein